MRDVDDDFIARQVRWQGAVVALRPSGPALLPLLIGLGRGLLGCLWHWRSATRCAGGQD
jgi:hypothetical protein